MALIFRRAAIGGYSGSVPIVLGLEAGVYLWALAAAAGFAALMAASQVAFVILKVVGAIVLLVMGIRSWRQAWRSRGVADGPPIDTEAQSGLGNRGRGRAFGEGLVVQLANPKAAVFMVAF